MYYLSDINTINFARKKGSKDKTKRKPVNMAKRQAAIGGVLGTGYGALMATQNPAISNAPTLAKVGYAGAMGAAGAAGSYAGYKLGQKLNKRLGIKQKKQ
jgi:hypothetical protein